MSLFKLLFAALCFCLFPVLSARADPVIVPLPLNSPVPVSLTSNPVVTIGTRTIDFTPNLNQQFISFLPNVSTSGNGTFRLTLGVRARDGLASISGIFPSSPDPTFTNQLPMFTVGTTDLLLFDFLIAGHNVPFSIVLTDLNGNSIGNIHVTQFSTPVPEPTTLLLLSMGLAGIGAARKKRRASRR